MKIKLNKKNSFFFGSFGISLNFNHEFEKKNFIKVFFSNYTNKVNFLDLNDDNWNFLRFFLKISNVLFSQNIVNIILV